MIVKLAAMEKEAALPGLGAAISWVAGKFGPKALATTGTAVGMGALTAAGKSAYNAIPGQPITRQVLGGVGSSLIPNLATGLGGAVMSR